MVRHCFLHLSIMALKRNSIQDTTRRRLQEQGTYLVNRMRSQGNSQEEILEALLKTGLSRMDALTILSGKQITSRSGSEQSASLPRKGRLNDQVILGIFMLIVGLGITTASVSAAAEGGGHFVVTTGIIAMGVALIIKGLLKK
jgi:hypothetical protein